MSHDRLLSDPDMIKISAKDDVDDADPRPCPPEAGTSAAPPP